MSATSTAAVASPASFSSRMLEMLEMRDNEETMNVGKKWTVEEDNKLLEEITDNKTYEEIALEHKRTVNSIELRVISRIIFPKMKADIEKGIDIDTSQLIIHLNKIKIKGEQKQKQSPKQTPKENPKQKDYLPTNKDILDYLKKLDGKIDEINSKLDNLEYLR
jgi:hypothetical protein